jgi:hypothetical protein
MSRFWILSRRQRMSRSKPHRADEPLRSASERISRERLGRFETQRTRTKRISN